ncbi:DNA sulfur modification protein DndD [Rhodoferax bucti]|uniref:DNA sulfur modification protein DndD n=1 Tax=Rhodoferax bucti TaxID=2576305 RepID=UPI001477827D|nr:DNA sulfur modification protein DndD [Rhodoferax bucti]
MLLKKLTLVDVGTYAGQQDFDLAPRIKYGAKRPIILFGGLNGTGKTTFLTAVRLALYGRQSLDVTPTQKEYEEYLLELIHRPRHLLVKAKQASVALVFEHARMGERATYNVVRFWEERGKGAEERLVIYRDDATEAYLSDEQAQSFLNQLVPPGVAQFFFFDGEKISSLAKDDSDAVLADAIKRLLGLDLVDRLNSDLNVFMRSHRASLGDKKLREEIDLHETALAAAEELSGLLGKKRNALEEQRTLATENFHNKKAELSSQGGAWSVNRSEREAELDRLREKRLRHEEALREGLNGLGVFALAPNACRRAIATLTAAEGQLDIETVKRAVTTRADELIDVLTKAISIGAKDQSTLAATVDAWVSGFDVGVSEAEKKVSLGSADIRQVRNALEGQVRIEHQTLKAEFQQARTTLEQEEKIQDQLAHAPSDDSIKAAFEAVTVAAQKLGGIEVERRMLIEEQRKVLWQSIELVRKLKKLEEKLVSEGGVERGHLAAESTQELIAEFKVSAAQHKCELLRQHFVKAFKRLARKDDIVRDAHIDAETFQVTLKDGSGRDVAKKRLSAGEKQIYSIAMLEALAKTSGRNLPVIIDTPLGRLDSKHRTKLVESYFPVASHQVIVLSTDTEVDSKFYDDLMNKISHAYHLSFDEDSGSTEVKPGYFWRNTAEVH